MCSEIKALEEHLTKPVENRVSVPLLGTRQSTAYIFKEARKERQEDLPLGTAFLSCQANQEPGVDFLISLPLSSKHRPQDDLPFNGRWFFQTYVV